MRIAVLDDEKQCLDDLKKLLKDIPLVKEVITFSTPQQLFFSLNCREQLDVIIMDIDLSKTGTKENGIDIAVQLKISNPEIQIIYLTGYNEKFAQQIFLKNANFYGYILKPVELSILKKNLENAQERIKNSQKNRLTIIHKNRPYTLFSNSIIYLESIGHKVVIHTASESMTCYEKLDELQARLGNYFLRCHKSYLINMDEVARLERNKFILLNGWEIPVSKPKYDSTRKQFFKYLSNTVNIKEQKHEL
ncbi:MAG: LytR/AlgR family response regulator transcription factor [Lachnospiraceae bacterium]